ncbi:unnamed protein product [Peniophora sp. CBMAI 1063]|nr:unnamed protein product [Peniophora sp. CBMAI 1063]
MSSGPSVVALGQLLQLCSRHLDVMQLLVSNPAALDTLSKHPEKALAALTELDGVEEEDIPYGLNSMGTPNMLARVQHLKALDISYEPSDTMYAQHVLNRTLSGIMVRTRIVCQSEQAQRTGCATLLMMRGPHQPYMPDTAGALGVFLSAVQRSEDWPVFENVFVSQTRDHGRNNLHADDWLYAGRYELVESQALRDAEIKDLPAESLEYWVIHIHRVKGAQLDRLRARIYLSVVDHLTTITEVDISRCIAEHDSDIVITAIRPSDIKDALLDGTIALQAFTMRPVGYDVGVPMLLKQTRERIQAEQEADDPEIEIISGPIRGTKRKTPPTSVESPRSRPGPGSGPSTPTATPMWRGGIDNGSLVPPMTRPRRSTVNAVNYRELDSPDPEGDREPPSYYPLRTGLLFLSFPASSPAQAMGKSTARKGKGKALPQPVEEPLQSIPETPQEEKAAAWGVPAIDANADSGGGGWAHDENNNAGWGEAGAGADDGGIPGAWDTEPAEHAHQQSPMSMNTPRTLAASPRSYADAKLDGRPPSLQGPPMGLQGPPMGLQQPPMGLQQPPEVDWGYPTKPPPAPAPPPAPTLRPSRQSSKNSKRAQAQPPRSSYKAQATHAAPAYTTQTSYSTTGYGAAPATTAYGVAPGTGRGGAGFGTWQNWAAEVGMQPPQQQQSQHVKFASHSTHIPSSVPSATMQQAYKSGWKTSGAGKYGRHGTQAAPAANSGWATTGGGAATGWDTGAQTHGQAWGAQDQGWGGNEQSAWDEGHGGGWEQGQNDEWGDEGWDEGGGDQWDNGGGGWDNGGHDAGGWGQEADEGWQDWPADNGKAWADTAEPAQAPPQSGHNDGWRNWGKNANGAQATQSWGGQRASGQQYWSPTPAGMDDRPISHTMAYATGSPTKTHKHHSYDGGQGRQSITIPPGWTLAHRGMDLYKAHKFKLTENGETLVALDLPLFNRGRMAKERLRWMFPPDKDKRVSVTLRWIKDVEHGLGAFALDVYLMRQERGALIVNAATFDPPAPEFDWLSYHDAKETLDKRIQESIVTYDPTKHAIIMVFLPSPSGNSAAVWRRRIEVPKGARSHRKGEIRSKPKVVVEKTVFVDELTKPEDLKRQKKEKNKKKGIWKRLFGGIKIVW